MAVHSMTGYGKAQTEIDHVTYVVEMRALNSKYADINLRIPSIFRDKEMRIRKKLTKNLQRGKIDFSLNVDTSETENMVINTEVLKSYHKQVSNISKELMMSKDSMLEVLMRLPNVVHQEEMEVDDTLWKEIEKTIDNAIEQLNSFRIQEGEALEKDLLKRVENIATALLEIESIEQGRFERKRKKIQQQLDGLKMEIDQNRFEQEMIFYLEKMDITEEITRLRNHIKYFAEILAAKENEKGKKTGFVAQEMGREINTIGSKANDADVQKLVIQMKDELEKIKEQALNIL